MASEAAGKPTARQTPPRADRPPIFARLGILRRVRAYFVDQGPWLLCSIVFHALLCCSIPLVVLAVGERMRESPNAERPPTFEHAKVDAAADADLKPFDLGQTPLDPTELNTETLTMEKPAELGHQAEYNDDRDEFEHRGGGIAAKSDQPNAGGLGGFEVRGIGPGPVARGRGGVGLGLGIGTHAGTGGDGWGFGGRGAGHREAMLASGGGTRQTERAVAGALNWLARHQSAHGGWNLQGFQNRCRGQTCTYPAIVGDAPAAATALGLLPFLAAGQTHRSKGPYKKNVEAGVKILVAHQNPKTGDLRMGTTLSMYDHGLAAIALCECYGMTGDRTLRQPAQAALDFIAAAQSPDGGWRYVPGEPVGDTSVTGWQIMALKSGQMAGLEPNPRTIEQAKVFLKAVSPSAVASAGGIFTYQPGSMTTECMTAVGLLCSQYLGMGKGDPVMVAGSSCLAQNAPDVRGHYLNDDVKIKLTGRNIYYWYYATQVMHNQPGPAWDKWNRKMRRVLIESQATAGCASGSWDPASPTEDYWGAYGGRLMMTSLSALTLEVYYRYLPLYQLDGGPAGGSQADGPRHAGGSGGSPGRPTAKPDAAKPKSKGKKTSQYTGPGS